MTVPRLRQGDEACDDCGGIHFGSAGCPYSETICGLCHKPLLAHDAYAFCDGAKAEHNPRAGTHCTCDKCVAEWQARTRVPKVCRACGQQVPVDTNRAALKSAASLLMESALRLLQEDPHLWSTRPCETCRVIGSIIGQKFGCYKYAAENLDKKREAKTV